MRLYLWGRHRLIELRSRDDGSLARYRAFPCRYVEKVSHNLGILQVRTYLHRCVGRPWLCNSIQRKTRIEQEVQPLTDGSGKPWGLKSAQAFLYFWRRCSENPFCDFPVQIAKVVANLNRVGPPLLIAEVPAMGCGKTRMFYGELQEPSRLDDAVGFSEKPLRFWDVHETHKADGKVERGIGEWKLDRARNPIVDAQRLLFL